MQKEDVLKKTVHSYINNKQKNHVNSSLKPDTVEKVKTANSIILFNKTSKKIKNSLKKTHNKNFSSNKQAIKTNQQIKSNKSKTRISTKYLNNNHKLLNNKITEAKTFNLQIHF